jgi:hypothetical protein
MALSRRSALPKFVVFFALVCGHATSYESGYFRYGTLSWQQTKIEADGITVKFTLKTAWARAMFSRREGDSPWGNCIACSVPATDATRQCDNEPTSKVPQSSCFLPVVGDWVALHDAVDTTPGQGATPGGILPWVETTFSFGDNLSRSLTGARQSTTSNYRPKCKDPADPAFGKCIEGVVVDSFAVNADAMPTPEENARDIVYVVSDIVYKYPRQTRSFLAEFTGCCRQSKSSQLVNNANGAWQLRAYVSITDDPLVMDTGTAASPVIEHTPVIHVIYGQALDFSVHAYDAADRPVKFRLGDSSEFGVDLSQQSQGQVSQGPYANAMDATINADTGVVTFPATEKTAYPDTYFNLVVVVTTLGPCQGYVSTSLSRRCDTPAGRPQTQKVTAILDFLVRVVYAGYSGIGAVRAQFVRPCVLILLYVSSVHTSMYVLILP